MGISSVLSVLGSRLSARTSGPPDARGARPFACREPGAVRRAPVPCRGPGAERRKRLAVPLALLAFATACVGDRDRLAPPTITMEIDSVVRPGASIGVRIVAVDRNSDLASVAARARAADSAFVQREELFGGFDSVEVSFDVRVASSAQDGDIVEVTGSAINEQLLSRDTVAFAVVRVPSP